MTTLSFDIYARDHASKDFDKLSRNLKKSVKDFDDFGNRAAGSFLKTANSLSNIPTAAAALQGVGSIFSGLSGVLGLVPAAAASAAAAIGTLAVGVSGFADGLKEAADTSKISKAASGASDAAEQAARRIESAQSSLARAMRGTKDAQENLTRAEENARDARVALTRAYEDAAEKLDDLNRSLAGAALDEESAVLAVERAQERLTEAAKSGAGSLDFREAELSVRQAEQALADTRDRYADLKVEAQQANAAGVNGSDEVISAQRQVADAALQVEHAQQGVADAAENVRDAQREVAQAHEDAARKIGGASAALAGSTEAFDKLSNNAKDTVRSILGLGGAWDDLRHSVQDALFAGIASQVKDLGGTYLPVLKSGMTGIAQEFNKSAVSVGDFLKQGAQVSSINTIFGGTKSVVGNLGATLKPLVSILLDIAAVGSEMLPGLTGGFGKAAEGAAAFVKHARETGRLREWIEKGLETLRKVGQLLSNIASIIGTVFSGLNAGGKNMLDTLISVTGQIKTFLQSVEGQKALKALGEALNAVSTVVTQVLIEALKQLAPIIVKLAPGFADLAKMVGDLLVGAIRIAGPLLAGLAKFFSDNVFWLGPLAIGLLAGAKAFAVVNAVLILMKKEALSNPWLLLIAATIALAILIVQNWDKIVAAIKAAIDWVVNFVKNNWELLISLILGPLGVLIVLIAKYWDDIIGFFVGAWNFIKENAVAAWEGIKNAIVDPIAGTALWVKGIIDDIIGFFAGMPRRIGEALGSIGSFVGDAFKGAANVAIDFINYMVDRINDFIYGVNVANPFSDIPYLGHIGRLHSGGVVPGQPGQESMWILEAGETVIPADYKPPAMGSATRQSQQPMAIVAELRVTGNGALYDLINNGLRTRQIQLSLAGA